MANINKKIYWDSCIFLAWFYNEPNEPSVVDGIEEMVRDIDNNRAKLITSIITRTELLESRMDDTARARFATLFQRRNVLMINLDHRISDLSHDIRDYYDQRGEKLTTPDCQHLATAIIHKVDFLYTLDGSGKKKKGTLLRLNGVVAGKHALKILKPHACQSNLFTGITHE
jgi:predicted nucleic acid-binding protein